MGFWSLVFLWLRLRNGGGVTTQRAVDPVIFDDGG